MEREEAQKMIDWFAERTNRHIKLAQKYTKKIADLNLPQVNNMLLMKEGEEHDKGKWEEPEYTPYLHITWRYKTAREGGKYEVPQGIEEKMNRATFTHIKSHRHHPEFWDDNATMNVVNPNNRDTPSGNIVDATKMPLSYVASMMADWLAISEELKSDVNEWIKKNVNIRWKFNLEQVALINEIAKKCLVDEK